MRAVNEWGVFWLRVALALYSVGLWHSFLTVVRRKRQIFLAALTSISVGVVFHTVSLVFETIAAGGPPVGNLYQAASLGSYLITLLFLGVYRRYRFESLAVFVFPTVFVLALVGSLGGPLEPWMAESVNRWWLGVHIGLFLLGNAALFLTFIAGVMYLIQEREVKSKNPRAFYYRLPPLNKLDEVGRRTLAFGFIAVTLGLIVSSVYAAARWGASWIVDPTIAFAFLTWAIYLAMVFSRWAVGWRGRKSAYFAIAGFCCAALTWIVNAGVHSFTP